MNEFIKKETMESTCSSAIYKTISDNNSYLLLFKMIRSQSFDWQQISFK